MTNNSNKHQIFVYTQLNDQTVLFLENLACHFFAHGLSVKQFYWTHRKDLSRTTTSGESRRGRNDKRVLHILQSSKTGVSPSDCLVSYVGHSLGWVLPPCRDWANMFSVV